MLKTLCHAERITFVDHAILIDNGFAWLLDQARDNGTLYERDRRLARVRQCAAGVHDRFSSHGGAGGVWGGWVGVRLCEMEREREVVSVWRGVSAFMSVS